MSSANRITSNGGGFADAQSLLSPLMRVEAASAANTIPLHDGHRSAAAALENIVVQALMAISGRTPCNTGKATQHKPELSTARSGELSGAALHRRHAKYRLLTNQPQITLDECVGFLCSPPLARKAQVHQSIPKKLPRRVLRQLQTKDGRRKMDEELRELWNNLDDANREEYDKRAAEITSWLSGHRHASKRG